VRKQLVKELSLGQTQLSGVLCRLALGQWTILILRENLKHTYLSQRIFPRFDFLRCDSLNINAIYLSNSVCKAY